MLMLYKLLQATFKTEQVLTIEKTLKKGKYTQSHRIIVAFKLVFTSKQKFGRQHILNDIERNKVTDNLKDNNNIKTDKDRLFVCEVQWDKDKRNTNEVEMFDVEKDELDVIVVVDCGIT